MHVAIEIEHKFLLLNEEWREQVERSERMTQGYLVAQAKSSVRLRIAGAMAWINIKSATVGISRSEYEYPVPVSDAEEMLANLSEGPLIDKTRHHVRHGEHLWEIDEFYGDNAGLIVAEIELSDEGEQFDKPTWAGEDVSHDVRYYNSMLTKKPYKSW
jgi:adenylate cyclase